MASRRHNRRPRIDNWDIWQSGKRFEVSVYFQFKGQYSQDGFVAVIPEDGHNIRGPVTELKAKDLKTLRSDVEAHITPITGEILCLVRACPSLLRPSGCEATIEAEKDVLADIDVEIALAKLDEPPTEKELTRKQKEELKHVADELREIADMSKAMRPFFGKDT